MVSYALTMAENSHVDHIIASERYRLETFSSALNYPAITRHQLALAGFIYRAGECVCPQCGVMIHLSSLDANDNYATNHFRGLHREKISYLGKRCAFLLCESGTNIDDLHLSFSSEHQDKPQWDDAEHPDFSDYTVRFQSFQSWTYSQQEENTFITPSMMAKHGFYFSGPKDGVTCFYCGNTLIDWKELIKSNNENVVQLEHARFFPCRFVTYTAGGKFVANAGYLHVVSDRERRARNPMTSKSVIISQVPQSIDECLLTFENWPEDAPISAKDLAQTGFYYLGEGLTVKCYMCQLEVDDWHHGMTALGTHRLRRNNCDIVRAILSTKTSEIQSVNEKWRLQTLEGLSFGFDHDEKLCRELAACGFYRFKNTSNIRCAYCGVLIQPKVDASIMSQHRSLAKQLKKSSALDCLMVRAQCPVNIVIPDRERFAEYREYRSVFERMKSFEIYRERHRVTDDFVRERADAGFFLDTNKRMRCFQCGNSLPINDKKLYEKYAQYDLPRLHAHFYPTCEWIKEILGSKYVGQVFFDRSKSNEIERQRSYTTQLSGTTDESFSSVSTTSGHLDLTSLTELNLSDYSEQSDDDGYETVATPLTAHFNDRILPTQSPPPPLRPTTPSKMAMPMDILQNDGQSEFTSLIRPNQVNPFQQLALESQSPPPTPEDSAHTDIAPIDPDACFAYEINRLESFKKQHRQTFARIEMEALANAGFYLNAEGTMVRCPRCKIEMTEEKFRDIIHRRPIIPGSPLNDEPWTAMRVHRHENGQSIDGDHPWCPWVRRAFDELYPNVVTNGSRMQYPEYPNYSSVEERVKSFQSDWIYPSGSRLSNLMMAHAGFIYVGEGKVCCYYCGNRLCNFDPLDCPFEEHVSFYPLCDYMIYKRGLPYIKRILQESHTKYLIEVFFLSSPIRMMFLAGHARQKYQINGEYKIKCILFEKAGLTTSKTQRRPAKRIKSRLSSSSSKTDGSLSLSTTHSLNLIENTCHLCCENLATYEYAPCQHYSMCGECTVKLTPEQHEECIICRRRAKIAEINPRASLNFY